jgi:hypothetical protein
MSMASFVIFREARACPFGRLRAGSEPVEGTFASRFYGNFRRRCRSHTHFSYSLLQNVRFALGCQCSARWIISNHTAQVGLN